MNKAHLSSTSRRCMIAALGFSATMVAAAPVSAAPQGPDDNASCVGQIFVPQALDDPAAFVARIAYSKARSESEGTRNFGAAIGGALGGPGLAHWDCPLP